MSKIKVLSKQQATRYRPVKRSLLISIQDGNKEYLPFKQRTNHITRDHYVDTLFVYFDDIDPIRDKMTYHSPNLFGETEARQIINFLDRHYARQDFDELIVHCQAGVSRSQAVGLFAAEVYERNTALVEHLNNQPGKLRGGNPHVNKILKDTYLKMRTHTCPNALFE